MQISSKGRQKTQKGPTRKKSTRIRGGGKNVSEREKPLKRNEMGRGERCWRIRKRRHTEGGDLSTSGAKSERVALVVGKTLTKERVKQERKKSLIPKRLSGEEKVDSYPEGDASSKSWLENGQKTKECNSHTIATAQGCVKEKKPGGGVLLKQLSTHGKTRRGGLKTKKHHHPLNKKKLCGRKMARRGRKKAGRGKCDKE